MVVQVEVVSGHTPAVRCTRFCWVNNLAVWSTNPSSFWCRSLRVPARQLVAAPQVGDDHHVAQQLVDGRLGEGLALVAGELTHRSEAAVLVGHETTIGAGAEAARQGTATRNTTSETFAAGINGQRR